MKIVVIGGTGLIGGKLVKLLRARGQRVVAAAPSRRVNTVTGNGLKEALASADVVVDVSNPATFEDLSKKEFSMISSSNVLAAAGAAGVRHFLALSIVGAERLPQSGYFRAKLAQEQLIQQSGLLYSIIRTTQFFESLSAIAESEAYGQVLRIPPATMQPIAADDAAAATAELSMGHPINQIVELAGPERVALHDVVKRYLLAINDCRAVVSDVHAPYLGAEIPKLALVPNKNARLGNTTLERWLNGPREARHQRQP